VEINKLGNNRPGTRGETNEVVCSIQQGEPMTECVGDKREHLGNTGETNRGTRREMRQGTKGETKSRKYRELTKNTNVGSGELTGELSGSTPRSDRKFTGNTPETYRELTGN